MQSPGFLSVRHRAILRRPPERGAELWPDDLHVIAWREETGEEVGASGGVVGEIEREDGDLHAAAR